MKKKNVLIDYLRKIFSSKDFTTLSLPEDSKTIGVYDKEFGIHIEPGQGTFDIPEFIEGVTVQCKNCYWWGESKHCGVMHSERFSAESWCSTVCPKQFFKPKTKG